MTSMTSPSSNPSLNLWPYAIVGWFAIFISALVAWMVFAVRQNLDLVRPDYYEQEIRFQEQLDRLNRTAAVSSEMAVQYEPATSAVTLRLPAAHLAQHPMGRIQFYRAADAALDCEVPLAMAADGVQRLSVRALRVGPWKMRVTWSVGSTEYFLEKTFIIAGAQDDPSAAAAPVK